MPDQPADPIHYDMKIPPEPKHDKESESEKTNAEQGAPGPGDAPDANSTRDEEQRPGR